MSHVFNMVGEISSAKLVSIKVTTPPSKTSYAAGEYFSTAGMVVEATYSNGVSATIAGYTYSPSGPLSENSTSITIQYTEGGITVTTTQSITIKKAPVATFANNDWDTIIEACQNNNVPNTWVVGNSKTMTINGRSYQIDIIGKNHDTYASGGTAPLTFQMHELYRTKYKMTSSYDATNSWKGSEMRVTHLPEIKALMPSVVKNAIRTVLKPTADDGWTPVIENVEDDLFYFQRLRFLVAVPTLAVVRVYSMLIMLQEIILKRVLINGGQGRLSMIVNKVLSLLLTIGKGPSPKCKQNL